MTETRLRSPNDLRDPLEEAGLKPATKNELEELRAKVNLLEYGGITADKLGGGTISTQSIELAASAQLFTGSPTGDGFVLDKNGLRFYAGGINTIDLRADGGAASFTGTITGGIFQTATSGKRIVIDSALFDQVEFFTGHGSETAPGNLAAGFSGDILELDHLSPRAGHDWVAVRAIGRSSGTPEAQAVLQAYNNAGTVLGSAILGSKNGPSGGSYFNVSGVTDLVLGDSALRYVGFPVDAGAMEFIRPATTATFQARFSAPGGAHAAIGIDIVVGNRLNVQSFDTTTPLAISASAFTVVSKTAGKSNIIARDGSVLERVMALRPVDYTRHDDKYTGFLVEELAEQFPEAVVRDANGEHHSIDLMAMVAILTEAIQEVTGG